MVAKAKHNYNNQVHPSQKVVQFESYPRDFSISIQSNLVVGGGGTTYKKCNKPKLTKYRIYNKAKQITKCVKLLLTYLSLAIKIHLIIIYCSTLNYLEFMQ